MKPIRLYLNEQITTELVIALIKQAALNGFQLGLRDIARERREAWEAARGRSEARV